MWQQADEIEAFFAAHPLPSNQRKLSQVREEPARRTHVRSGPFSSVNYQVLPDLYP